jgi:hypothetical protein
LAAFQCESSWLDENASSKTNLPFSHMTGSPSVANTEPPNENANMTSNKFRDSNNDISVPFIFLMPLGRNDSVVQRLKPVE